MNNATIKAANKYIASLLPGLQAAVDLAIADNVPHSLRNFFLSGVNNWTLEVYHDQDEHIKNDDLMSVKIPYGMFPNQIQTSADLVAYYMHSMSHVMCKFLWRHVPDGTYNRQFSTPEVNLMEEVYNQVIMYFICNKTYHDS